MIDLDRQDLEQSFGFDVVGFPPAEPLWPRVAAEVASCGKCTLSLCRKNTVFGEGSLQAVVLFVGEAPGAEEERFARPFVGAAGELLDKMIKAMGYAREDLYITNTLKCRPPENRNPAPAELEACRDYLEKQIEMLAPKVIVALGSTAAKVLLDDPDLRLEQRRGHWASLAISQKTGLPVMPTFHPSYLLRNPEMKREAWQDLQLVMKELS